jgi:hypothetical protein
MQILPTRQNLQGEKKANSGASPLFSTLCAFGTPLALKFSPTPAFAFGTLAPYG